MGDAPIVVRGLVKALKELNLDNVIPGVYPKTDGERLAVFLAANLKETGTFDLHKLSLVSREGRSGLFGRGDAAWDDLPINEQIAQYLA